jgi:hypothetical protein
VYAAEELIGADNHQDSPNDSGAYQPIFDAQDNKEIGNVKPAL